MSKKTSICKVSENDKSPLIGMCGKKGVVGTTRWDVVTCINCIKQKPKKHN